MAEHDPDGYTGPAVLHVEGRELAVHVRLDARHEPQDGRLHWFGRMRLPGIDGPAPAMPTTGKLQVGDRLAPVRVGDLDLWGRYRVTGVGIPPYPREHPILT